MLLLYPACHRNIKRPQPDSQTHPESKSWEESHSPCQQESQRLVDQKGTWSLTFVL